MRPNVNIQLITAAILSLGGLILLFCGVFIAPGTYPLRLTWSPRFQKLTPEVCDVPDRAGLRFHLGTKPEHSQGCVLLQPEALANLKIFINRIKNLYDNEEVFIEISDGSTDA